ncbi:amidohydrolase [Salmonella enterica]|nr:amidohydrolase [Salmonella enterica]
MCEFNESQLRQWRRLFHRIPECGWSEFTTTATLITLLREMGYTVLTGEKFLNPEHILGRNQTEVNAGIRRAQESGVDPVLIAEMNELTGCMAILDTGLPGPTIAMRFDIDCVAVNESDDVTHLPVKEGFSSLNPGYMHACAHDGHMAIGLGIAQWLIGMQDTLAGKFKLIFQPAEEGVRGAKPVAESGVLDDVDYFLSAHLGMGCPSHEVIVNPQDFLCTTKLDFRFFGTPAHAGVNPHTGNNALMGACHCATQLMGIARHGEGMSRINIGVLNAGEGRNVIPSKAKMMIEVRGENKKINQYMVNRALCVGQGAAQSFNLRFEHEIMGEAVDLHNDPELVSIVGEVAHNQLGLTLREGLFGGSEDVTLLVKRVQEKGGKAIYFVLGADLTAGHHETRFDFDESSLLNGVKIFSACIKKLTEK